MVNNDAAVTNGKTKILYNNNNDHKYPDRDRCNGEINADKLQDRAAKEESKTSGVCRKSISMVVLASTGSSLSFAFFRNVFSSILGRTN